MILKNHPKLYKMNQKDKLIALIGQTGFDAITAQIPGPYMQPLVANFADHLLTLSEPQIINFYADLLNDQNYLSPMRLAGSVVLLASHVHDLLKKLVDKRETDIARSSAIKDFDLHYIIIFCAHQYGFPKDIYVPMMALKHYRNLLAHDFNGLLNAPPADMFDKVAHGYVTVLSITQYINNSP